MGLEAGDNPKYQISNADARSIKRYQVMRNMGWDYETYQNTPVSVVNQIYQLIITENTAYNDKNKKD
jgi:hypothetical protein